MSKKRDAFYFNNFIECSEICLEAALMLKQTIETFDTKTLDDSLSKMHVLEHKGDKKKHEMMSNLVKEFITPIERNDIIALSQTLDNVTDSIEDVLIHIHITGIKEIRSDCKDFLDILIKACEALKNLLEEFKTFKKSKKLTELIIEINHIEETGDDLYISAMRKLHTTTTDTLEIIAWREIYKFFEKVYDACEDVADIVESVAIVNT